MSARDVLRVAAVQLSSQTDVSRNLEACRELVAQAAERGAEMVVLPENFAYLGAEAGRRELAERLGDFEAPIQSALAGMARASGVTVVGGGFPEASDDPSRPYNTCVVVSHDGRIAATYRKIHLFDVRLPDGKELRESTASTAGTEPVVTEASGFCFGLSICYDLRFPELYRELVSRGADVLLIPAAFTLQTGGDHWHILVRARAIESQAWVVAANQWGRHSQQRASYGHSMVVDPWGRVVAECPDGVGLVTAELEQSAVERVRTNLPCLRHRRL